MHYLKHLFFAFGLVLLWGVSISPASAALIDDVRGKILLQVENNGEAWYVNPSTDTRFYMGRPNDAFQLMRTLGLGISDKDLSTIPERGALSSGDIGLRTRLAGSILLQVEANGEAWYVNPDNTHRYFLGRPNDAFSLMRELGLGISNSNLSLIPIDPNSALPVTIEESNCIEEIDCFLTSITAGFPANLGQTFSFDFLGFVFTTEVLMKVSAEDAQGNHRFIQHVLDYRLDLSPELLTQISANVDVNQFKADLAELQEEHKYRVGQEPTVCTYKKSDRELVRQQIRNWSNGSFSLTDWDFASCDYPNGQEAGQEIDAELEQAVIELFEEAFADL